MPTLAKLRKKRLIDFLKEMEDPRKDILIEIYHDHKDLFYYAQGSSHNHQAWKGGYVDHIAEIIRFNYLDYAVRSSDPSTPLDFTRDNATIALFFHDMEKPFRYGPLGNPHCEKWRKLYTSAAAWEKAKWDIIHEMEDIYGMYFTGDELNALKYTHGEGSDHRKDMCVSTPLAAHVHHCDNTSARIFPNDGKGLG